MFGYTISYIVYSIFMHSALALLLLAPVLLLLAVCSQTLMSSSRHIGAGLITSIFLCLLVLSLAGWLFSQAWLLHILADKAYLGF